MVVLCGFGVSNYYNKLKLFMLEQKIAFSERLVYPWERDTFLQSSPLGRIPFIETENGGLSESQVILDYLEDSFPDRPLYPSDIFERAKCRELIQHLELNSEWVARRLYREELFGGNVSEETKQEVREKLTIGLGGIVRLATFSPYVFGASFCAADCVAYMHFYMIRMSTMTIYGEDMLKKFVPEANRYMELMESRPHVQSTMADRAKALATFISLNVIYYG
ncbi:MAG: glutathione S-transferase [Aestuariivirga sp.]